MYRLAPPPQCARFGCSSHICYSEAHGKDIKFAKLDIDAQDEIAANSGINVVPTFQFFESGKVRPV